MKPRRRGRARPPLALSLPAPLAALPAAIGALRRGREGARDHPIFFICMHAQLIMRDTRALISSSPELEPIATRTDTPIAMVGLTELCRIHVHGHMYTCTQLAI